MNNDEELKGVQPKVEPAVTFDNELGEISQAGFWLKTRSWIHKMGAEEIGIERIPESMRTNQHVWDLFTIFFSANTSIPTLALGFLGPPVFGLGWWDSFLTLIFFNLIGGLWPAAAACWGPRLGLRTMLVPRYSFGWWFSKVTALLNILNQLGWGMVNVISGSSVLYDAGSGRLPLAVAVLLISIVSVVIGIFGYEIVHTYERYAWIAILLCFCVLAGFGGNKFVDVPMSSGSAEASKVLTFGSVIIGYQVAWLPIAADYGVYMREDISGWTTFAWTYAGLSLSQIFIELLGAAVGTLAFSNNPDIVAAYTDRGLGGLIGACFMGHGAGARGFGKFIEVVFALSAVAVVVTNIYSLGLSAQMVSQRLIVVPRLVWSLVGGVVILVCSIAGRDHLESVMENFLNICAYWLVPFGTILFLEHFIWRRGYAYDLSAWNDRTKLPKGYAAFLTFVICTVLALLCMSQVWWVGPIALAIGGGPDGTDIGWILSFGATCVLYIPLRAWERRIWKL